MRILKPRQVLYKAGGYAWTSDKNSLCYVTLTAWNDSKHTYMDVLAF